MSRYDMIKGIIPPIITPMNEDESFNEAEFRKQIERQIEGGVHGIFCYGTNGECYALNTQEKEEILKAAVDQIKGRVPVYAGTSADTFSTSTPLYSPKVTSGFTATVAV